MQHKITVRRFYVVHAADPQLQYENFFFEEGGKQNGFIFYQYKGDILMISAKKYNLLYSGIEGKVKGWGPNSTF